VTKLRYGDNCHVDDHSQLMLLEFLDRDEPLGTGDLTKPAGFEADEYNKVRHRLKKNLEPGGLVRQVEPVEIGGQERLRYEITAAGEQFVDDHRDVIGSLPQVDEIATEASEAKEEANRAQDRVDSYSTKLQRVKDGVDDLEEDVGELEETLGEVAGYTQQLFENSVHKHPEKINELEGSVSTLEKQLSSLETQLDTLSSTVSKKASNSAVQSNQNQIESLREDYQQFYAEFEDLRDTPSRTERLYGALCSLWAAVVFVLTTPGKLLAALAPDRGRSHGHTSRSSRSVLSTLKSAGKTILIGTAFLFLLAMAGIWLWYGYNALQPLI